MTTTDIAHIAELWHADPEAALELADEWNASRSADENGVSGGSNATSQLRPGKAVK